MPPPVRCFVVAALLLVPALVTPWLAAPALAAGDAPVVERILPPESPWNGASRALMVAPDDPWITPAEASGLVRTPNYEQTVAYLKRLAAAAPELALESIGTSPEGRDLWLAIVATGVETFTPEALRATGKPILFAQAGIHAGEIDGKDAGLMLLRDLTVRGNQKALLDKASFVFVPIFNVDGHERASRFGRINQRGPEVMGWRTTARNLNLNRDYAKLDTPEMRHMIAALRAWQPDLYVDLHVTDGIDYQYDITWGSSGEQSGSPAIARWLETVMRPFVRDALTAHGHIPGPLIFAIDNQDIRNGLFDWSASTPRFSDGYGAVRHLPTVLVENHSLKPYDQRVLGTYLFLESTLRLLGERGEGLREATRKDRARRPSPVPLAWTVPQDRTPRTMTMRAIRAERRASRAMGAEAVAWTGEPISLEVPVFEPVSVSAEVTRPAAYWIPPAWPEVAERLAAHGIIFERLVKPREVQVEIYRLESPQIDPQPLEGHARVTAETHTEVRRQRFPAGSLRVDTDQPLGDLAAMLLEPASPDSFFQWGFFLEILQRTEYFDSYVMAPTADAMLDNDPELANAFEQALAQDQELAADPQARLMWLYRRSPYFDDRWLLYPVAREMPPPAAEPSAADHATGS